MRPTISIPTHLGAPTKIAEYLYWQLNSPEITERPILEIPGNMSGKKLKKILFLLKQIKTRPS